MSTDTQLDLVERRIHELYATDAQFAAARPDEAGVRARSRTPVAVWRPRSAARAR
jgi:hypothetical protein